MSDLEGSPVKCNSSLGQDIIQDDLSATFTDDSFDIFDIDYSALQKKALKEAFLALKEEEDSEEVEVSKTIKTTKLEKQEDSEGLEVVSCVVKGARDDDNDISIVDSYDCTLLDSSDIVEVEDCGANKENTRRSSRLKRRNSGKSKSDKTTASSKKMSTMNKELEALSKRISENNKLCDQHNQSDVMILSDDDDEDCNQEIRLRIKWGSELLRIPIRQLQPFSEVYGILGEKYGVSASRVMLSYNHRLIPPTVCPHDLNITLADFIEGGILQEEEVDEVRSSSRGAGVSIQPCVTHSADSIPLKVQNSNHKETVTIHIAKTDKMKILMHRYAEVQKVKLADLKFFFDGEVLNPSETPVSLDLDGGECIDVYNR